MTCAVLITPLVDVVPKIDDCDYIGVDAGALKIIDQHLPIKMAVGDFDSLNEEDLKRITCPIERHPIMKDETDSELAIRLCKDYDTIYLYGGIQGRIDHTIANIRLAMYRFNNLVLIDEHQKISVMNVGEYEIEVKDETAENGKRWETKYGLKAFLCGSHRYPYTEDRHE